MKKNEIYRLSVTGISSDGSGVARLDSFVIFIPGTVSGETVEAKILKVKKNIAYAKSEKILVPSENRINSSCEVAQPCGGCCYLHMDYEEQLRVKRQKVVDCLKRIGKLDCPVAETIPSPEVLHYRNKVLIPVGRNAQGEICAGFYAPRSHRIHAADACLIQDTKASEVIRCVKNWMNTFQITPYEEGTHSGIIRHIYFRMGRSTGQIMAGVVANTEMLPHAEELAKALLSVAGVTSVIHNVNCEKTNVVLGKKTNFLAGSDNIEDVILDTRFHIGPLSFYQVNPSQTARLYQTALDGLQLTKKDVLFDIYCGIGTIGLCAAKKIKRLIGIEVVPEAIQYAKQNAGLNHIENAEFFVGKAEEKIYDLIHRGDIPTVTVLDPPRAGCDRKLLDAVIQLSPGKLCYISCDPATLARDLSYLNEHSDYQIRSVIPVDMFPQTSHVESVALLTLSN